MTKLLIAYLASYERRYTFKTFISLLAKSKYLSEVHIFILSHCDGISYYKSAIPSGLNTIFFHQVEGGSHNYIEKLKFAVEYAKGELIPYIMKCDDDVFISPQTFDFIFENLDILNGSEYLTIGPTLSNGIPSFEYFMKDYFTESEKNVAIDMILNTKHYNRDGVSYESLNKHTLETSVWNPDSYFKSVSAIPHHYKGVHPMRFNKDLQEYINSTIIKRDDIFNMREMSLIYDSISPYLCNTIFCIKTSVYENILNDEELYEDLYDEVPLNKYAWKNNLGHIFIKNGFAIHMYYNWIPNHNTLEVDFCSQINKKW